MKLIVCGGGTGGHIYPALAIADYFKSKNDDTEADLKLLISKGFKEK